MLSTGCNTQKDVGIINQLQQVGANMSDILEGAGMVVFIVLLIVFLGMLGWGAYQLLSLIPGFTELPFFTRVCVMVYAVSLIRISVSAKEG